jgi:soluble lytic murein transglycosylase-like protein
LLGATPASADVIELAPDGTVLVRAADRLSVAAETGAPEQVGELQLPAEAITLTTASAAPAAYAALVEQLAEAHHISPALLEAVVWQESRWRPDARSPVGAIGLAQLMPGTARDLGVNPLDPAENLYGGARYLRQQLDRFGGDVERALAAYNAGPGRVLRAGGIPRITETQNYVRSVVDRLSNSTKSQGRAR